LEHVDELGLALRLFLYSSKRATSKSNSPAPLVTPPSHPTAYNLPVAIEPPSHTVVRCIPVDHMNVCDGHYSDEFCRDALPALNTWLKYLGGLPPNLTIATDAPRWKTVRIHVQNSPAIYRLLARAFIGCPSLSVLVIMDNGPETELDNALIAFDLHLAPLRRLALSLVGLAIRNVHAPWTSLTSLSFMHDTHASLSSITDYLAVAMHVTERALYNHRWRTSRCSYTACHAPQPQGSTAPGPSERQQHHSVR